ncbi:unnamed protein product [Sphagnum balticum]
MKISKSTNKRQSTIDNGSKRIKTSTKKSRIEGKNYLFGSGKKAGVVRNTSRRALADKTNESPSSGLTPMMVKEGDRVDSFKGTPYPKLHELRKATAGVPAAEEALCCTQVHTLPHKLEMGESGLHRMPSEFGTPGELAAPTPANTPINVPFSFGHTAFTPCFMIAPPVFEDKVDVSMSPGQEEEEEELNANNVEVGKHVDEDEEDDVSECSVVVNVSSPHLDERHDAPSKFSMAHNKTEYSLEHMNSTQKAKSYQDEGFGEYDYYPEDDEDEYEDVELDGECNELCDAISQFTMKENDGAGGLPVSTGQHIRFSYDSDDEIEALIVDAEPPHQQDSPTALRLKGLPTPKGKHLRFNEEDSGSPSV